KVIDGLTFPNVRDNDLHDIWHNSDLFQRFRGTKWMKEPCASCPEKEIDLGGCRCQAYLLTGDAYATDPVCSLSPDHQLVRNALRNNEISDDETRPLLFRNTANARALRKKEPS